MTPEPYGDGLAYVARGEFMPLAVLTADGGTPSEPAAGGRCPHLVARGRYVDFLTSKIKGLRRSGCRSRRRWWQSDGGNAAHGFGRVPSPPTVAFRDDAPRGAAIPLKSLLRRVAG